MKMKIAGTLLLRSFYFGLVSLFVFNINVPASGFFSQRILASFHLKQAGVVMKLAEGENDADYQILKMRAAKRVSEVHLENYNLEGATVVRDIVQDHFLLEEMRRLSGPKEAATENCELVKLILNSPVSAVVTRILSSKRSVLLKAFMKKSERAEEPDLRDDALSSSLMWTRNLDFMQNTSGNQICSAFLALEDLSYQKVPSFLVGSHLWDTSRADAGFQFPEEGGRGWDLGPGDLLVAHGRAVGKGWQRRSGRQRTTQPGGEGRQREDGGLLALHYAGDDATVAVAPPAGSGVPRLLLGGNLPAGSSIVDSAWDQMARNRKGDIGGYDMDIIPAWEDPFFGVRGRQPTSVLQWSKGVAPPGKQWYN